MLPRNVDREWEFAKGGVRSSTPPQHPKSLRNAQEVGVSIKDSACLPALTPSLVSENLHGSCSMTCVHRNVCACASRNALGPKPAKIYAHA